MAQLKIKSLRDPAIDTVKLLLLEEGFSSLEGLADGVVHILDRVAGYREEGARLFPEILITRDIGAIAKTLPGPMIVTVTEGAPAAAILHTALKSCAPLARDGWAVFISVRDDQYQAGVITCGGGSLQAAPSAHLLPAFDSLPVPALLMRGVSGTRVRIIGRRDSVELRFALADDESDDRAAISGIAGAATRAVEDAHAADVCDHLTGLIQQACEESHGCLLAVTDGSEDANSIIRSNSSRHAFLRQAINFTELVKRAREDDTREAHAVLYSFSSLARRMIGHDGITVLSTDGRLLAYNVIIKNDPTVPDTAVGGARSRAFATLRSLAPVDAALVRSQDGATQFWRREE